MGKFVSKFGILAAVAATGLIFAMSGCAETPCEDAYSSAKTCSAEAGIDLNETKYLAECENDLTDAVATKEDVRCVADAAGDCEMISECND